MTSEGEAQKTSEFLRRRKLRLQQVREQSKDIAKKLRQRAKVENLQVTEFDEKKEREYIQSQEKVVKKLEELYSRGLDNIGSSHKQARGLTQPVSANFVKKTDLSHLRGREASAELKRQKQQKLDELKKSLDRKIQARENANVLSREKSVTTVHKLSTKSSSTKLKVDDAKMSAFEDFTCDNQLGDKNIPKEVSRNDMGTQWDFDIIPSECEPVISALAIPQDESTKQSIENSDNNADKQTQRTNLFALSDEMPLDLRGGTHKTCDTGPLKLSSTLVSEYIQNRSLRLRESEVITKCKKQSVDLKNLRQTIIRSRPLKSEGSGGFNNICHVVEGKVFPVPMWHPENSYQCQTPMTYHQKQYPEKRQSINVAHADIDKIFNSFCPVKPISGLDPVTKKTRSSMPHKDRHYEQSVNLDNGAFLGGKGSDNLLTKKKSVTMYNHATKDSRDVPRTDEQIVYRDVHSEKDAYCQALSESTSTCNHEKQKKNQDTTNKIAVTRQNVEKEYNDTIAFLNSLPKNKNTRRTSNAFKDEHRLEAQRETRQRILQQQFKNIEQESRRQDSNSCKVKSKVPHRSHSKRSKSPSDSIAENNFNDRDLQYSWMPIPESDSNLFVHTIPTSVRSGRSRAGAGAGAGAAVKFSKVDTYHEYRCRHKHTPPTKDTGSCDRTSNKRFVETVIFQQNDDSSSGQSNPSDNNSTDGQESDPKENIKTSDNETTELTDAERIIICKILSYKHRKNNKAERINNADDVVQKELNGKEKTSKLSNPNIVDNLAKFKKNDGSETANNPLSGDNLKEGLYKVDGDTELWHNILNYSPTEEDTWESKPDLEHWWDNLNSIYHQICNKSQSKKTDKCDKHEAGTCSGRTVVMGSTLQGRKKCTSKCKNNREEDKDPSGKAAAAAAASSAPAPAPAPSPASGSTSEPPRASVLDARFVKLIDEGEKQDGNFYIGATGFLKDNAYEVVIQLRKKGTQKGIETTENESADQDTPNPKNEDSDTKQVIPESLQTVEPQSKALNDESEYSVATNPQRCITECLTNLTQHNEKQDQIGDLSDHVILTKTKYNKSVSTCFEDNYTVPEPLAKSDPNAATSAYTQTTPSSPTSRPLYIHMSSSTSTAYMSPPDVVLPNFLKRGRESCRKVHRMTQNIDKREETNIIRQENHCKKYSSCKIFNNILTEPQKHRLKSNTARTLKADAACGTYNVYRETRESTLSSPMLHLTHCKCVKGNIVSNLYCKKHSPQNKFQPRTTKPTMSTWNAMTYTLRNKRSKNLTRASKSYISSIIREYIHKLLTMKREDINAIQVFSQDCSSVNTPASSIINVPTNLTSKQSNLDPDCDFSLDHIKELIKQNILRNNSMYQRSGCPADRKTENVVSKNKNLRKRNSKRKILHKVKSLKISKKILVEPRDASTNTKLTNSRNIQLSCDLISQRSPSENIQSHGEMSDSNNILSAHISDKVLYKIKSQCVNDYSSTMQPKTAMSSGITSHNNNADVNNIEAPNNNSTQTRCTVGNELNFIKMAEDKLQNMEKIADLTEKCTKRLSNLAKVLEEVRKNKSLAYSHISTPNSTSDSDQKADKDVNTENTNVKSLPTIDTIKTTKDDYNVEFLDYESLLSGVPKPSNSPCEINYNNTELTSTGHMGNDDFRVTNNLKLRNKPPPALLRINLKRSQENVVPHELSTVIEVDSPLSVQFKSHTSTNANQSAKNSYYSKKDEKGDEETQLNPELIFNILNKSNGDKVKLISTDSTEASRLQMMDLNQFNEIMLRPFISLQEYAQDYYEGNMDSKVENVPKDNGLAEELSSFNSDGSLPDVVAELLKRKLISEPFKFDTASNVNSTTMSSESTLSVLAFSKLRKDGSKLKLAANKENMGETSDSFSISSNPDLENAFKKLGMGWASSTLKKTKERLALSSSSNTSSSSLSHIKFKNSNSKQDLLVMDAVPSTSNLSKKQLDASKNAEQQTSLCNSMTVKEFLTKELAKKITFTKKPNRNDTNPEFVSLFETKPPVDLKHSSQILLEQNSGDSDPSGTNNRARTSTPVNIFKSATYHSSSSSNLSNGLFSNADDLSSVKLTSASMRYQSTSEKDELTIPNCSLKMRKDISDCSKTDSYN